MKIIITGSNGRLGRAIVGMAVAAGHEVVAIDRTATSCGESCKEHVIDMSDYEGLVTAFHGADALIHMAAIPNPAGQRDHEVHANNVTGSYNAMRAAVQAGIKRICQASSINAIGVAYSRRPRFDYFPIDEKHPSYAEDAYSLSKQICEVQADALVRAFPAISVASLRFHWVIPERQMALDRFGLDSADGKRELWAYTLSHEAARACLLSVGGLFSGHEVFNIVAPDVSFDTSTKVALDRYFPDVPRRIDFGDRSSLFCGKKAERILGFHHEGSAA